MTIDSIDIDPSARVGDRRRAEREAVGELLRRNGLGTLTHDDQGAPHLEGMFISVSHSREKAVIAFSSDSPLGVDTEPACVIIGKKFACDFSHAVNSFRALDCVLRRSGVGCRRAERAY